MDIVADWNSENKAFMPCFVTDIRNLKQNVFLGHMTRIVKISILCTFKDTRFQLLTVIGIDDSSLVGPYTLCSSSY